MQAPHLFRRSPRLRPFPAPDYSIRTASAKPVEPASSLALAATLPSAQPIPVAPVETASAETATSDEPFGLVPRAPGTDVPLPMARPGKPKIDVPEAGPALAYARTEDDDEEMPGIRQAGLDAERPQWGGDLRYRGQHRLSAERRKARSPFRPRRHARQAALRRQENARPNPAAHL